MMASIGSLPFLLETRAETFVLRDTRSYHSLRFPLKVCGIRGLLWGSKRIRAIGSKSFGTNEDKGGSEDVIQATIEKSKKVLALQRDLLQQIAERKKLVSSINSDSILESEGSSISYERSDKCLSNKSSLQNASISGGNEVENQNGGIVLSKYVNSSINSDNILESERNSISYEHSDKSLSNKSNP